MTSLSQADIEAKLAEYCDPYLRQDLRAAKVIQHIDIQAKQIKIDIKMGYPILGMLATLVSALKTLMAEITTLPVEINVSSVIEPHIGQRGIQGIAHIKNIIAIASGKGGVGKSTTAVNLALALAKEGANIGILDADIYGPSQPTMLGVSEIPELKDKKALLPIIRHGIQSMSIGYLVDKASPMVWRGPMVSMALQQLINETAWSDLDYLIIDLPPGTGDIQLTLAQKIPVSAAVIVTTPQDLALIDARRAAEMFRKVNVPILGVIENMSGHTCAHCGHIEQIFGAKGGEKLAETVGIELLGALPLDVQIREQTDGGTPTVVKDPEGKNAKIYRDIARRIAAKLSLQQKDYSHKFPNIVVKNN